MTGLGSDPSGDWKLLRWLGLGVKDQLSLTAPLPDDGLAEGVSAR